MSLSSLCTECHSPCEWDSSICLDCRERLADEAFQNLPPPTKVRGARSYEAISFADIELSSVEYLIDDRIPYGMLSAIYGDSGVGKSTLVDVLVTTITTGGPFPGHEGSVKQGSVFVVSYEQLADKVQGPRLLRMGARLNKVHIPVFRDEASGRKRAMRTSDIDQLRELILETGDVLALIIDPIMSYVGGLTDTNMDNAVRGDLQPLVDLVEELDIAGIIVGHLNKKDSKALYRASGSQAFINLPRSIFVAARHETTKQTALAHLLNNAGRLGKPLEYKIDDSGEFSWLGVNENLTVEEMLAPRKAGRPRGDKSSEDECASWLLSVVPPDEGVSSMDIALWAREREYTEVVMKRAKKIAEIVSRRPKGETKGWEFHRDDCVCGVCEVWRHESRLKEKTAYQRKLMNLNPEKFGDI